MVDHEAGVTSSTGADQNCAWFVFDIVFIFHCNDARPSLLDNMVARNREDVKGDKEREYYLGHSVKALAGRWQKGALSLSLCSQLASNTVRFKAIHTQQTVKLVCRKGCVLVHQGEGQRCSRQ